jgi:hypothetical protein
VVHASVLVNTYNYAQNYSNQIFQTVKDFSISIQPGTRQISRGRTVSSSVTVTGLSTFTVTFNLSCGGMPAGAACSIAPSQVTLYGFDTLQATLTVTIGTSTPSGRYNATVTGASALNSHTATALMIIP